ncbi:MAG TPA: cytochrome c [Verrucomicrobiota bacterium]|nr:cytochrome c [Verrucomicrobiota bacterium]
MSPEPLPPSSPPTEAAEPRAGNVAVPVWLLVLLSVLLYWGMVYFDQHSGWFNPQVYAPYRSLEELVLYQPPSGGIDVMRGKALYEGLCGLCHGNDGKGKPGQAPPFAGAEWAVGNPNRVIRIPLAGLTGPIQVNGQEWNLSMPAMGAALPDDDLAAVLTYIRQSWGNKASVITPDQVKAVRAEIGNRTQPWTAEQLNAIQ